MTKTLKAVNWNDPSCKFYDDIYKKQTQQFWLPEEIPVSDDKECWSNLDEKTKETYERILAGLTLLDTNQTTGINKVAEQSDNMFIQSLLSIHLIVARIYGLQSHHLLDNPVCHFDCSNQHKHIEYKFSYIAP